MSADLPTMRGIAEKATTLPWSKRYFLGEADWPVVISDGVGPICGDVRGSIADADAAFIVSACNSHSALLDEIEALRAELEHCRKVRESWRGAMPKEIDKP